MGRRSSEKCAIYLGVEMEMKMKIEMEMEMTIKTRQAYTTVFTLLSYIGTFNFSVWIIVFMPSH